MDVIETLQRSRPEVVYLFDELVGTVPDGVHLESVRQTGPRITITGVAQSSTRVSTFMRNIDNSEWLTDPGLDVVQTSGRGRRGPLGPLHHFRHANASRRNGRREADG